MRLVCFVLIVLLLPQFSSACVHLNEIHPNPYDSKNEWIELFNNCSQTVNVSGFMVGDAVRNYTINGTVGSGSFLVIANNASLFSIYYNTTDVSGLGGVNYWMNNGGDTIMLFNGTETDRVSYTSSEKNVSIMLCNGSWTSGEPSPGEENHCIQPPENVTEDNVTNETEAYDFSGISVIVQGPAAESRFGDFSQVSAVLETGEGIVPLRIVTYIYSPRWASTDLSGETIKSHLNETPTVLELQTSGNGESFILMLPVFIKSNCDGDYESGIYTGRVRVYEGFRDSVVSEDKFNITLEGNNPVFCGECEECEECECKQKSCSCGTDVVTKDGKTDLIELVSFPENVTGGEDFEVVVRVENPDNYQRNFSVYSYSYQGSRCLTYGFGEGGWKKTWTANRKDFALMPGMTEEVKLASRFPEDTQPGIYTFRIRLKYLGKDYDITRALKVSKPPEGPHFNVTIVTIVVNDTHDNETSPEQDVEPEGGLPLSGMVTAVDEGDAESMMNLYESFISWLISLFKF